MPNEGNGEKTVGSVSELLDLAVRALVGEDVCAVCSGLGIASCDTTS